MQNSVAAGFLVAVLSCTSLATSTNAAAAGADACARTITHTYARIVRADLRLLWGCVTSIHRDGSAGAEPHCKPLRTAGLGVDRVTTAALRRIRLRCREWPQWLGPPSCDALEDASDRARLEACAAHTAHCIAVRAVAEVLGPDAAAVLAAQHPDNLELDLGGIAGNRLSACIPPPTSTTTTTTTLPLPPTTVPVTTTEPAPPTTVPVTTTEPAPPTTTLVTPLDTTSTLPEPTTTLPDEPTTTTPDEPTTTLAHEPTTTLPPPATTTLPEQTTTTLPDLTTTTSSTTTTTTTTSTTTTTTTTTTLPPPPRLLLTEIASNPEAASDATGEYFEIRNVGTAALDLSGMVVRDNGSDTFTVSGSLVVQPGAYVVLGRSASAAGGHVDYVYGSGMSLTNTSDAVVLVHGGQVLDAVAYGTGFPLAAGSAISLRPGIIDAAGNDVASAWCRETAPLGNGDFGSPGRATTACAP